jgi:YidC/Oxa1 family membrane protein insertase
MNMNYLSAALGYLMSWCYDLISNYGIAIILFTLISKIILLPISIWVQKNSIKMVKMQPEINRLKVKHYGDKDAIAEQQAKIFKREKYNPLASLIPLAIQIVLLIGLVAVIYHPFNYILHMPQGLIDELNNLAVNLLGVDPESSSIQLSVVNAIHSGNYSEQFKGVIASYQGIDTTAVFDSIKNLRMSFCGFDLSWVPVTTGGIALLVPVIAGVSAWLLCVAQNASNVLQAEQSKLNKYGMMALSVGLSLYLGAFVPAGVALYWVASNIFAILQLYLLNWAINPKHYVNYEELEKSKQALAQLEMLGGGKKKFRKDVNAKREKADYKRFFSVINKHLVFYSESNGFYKYFGGIIEYILNNTNITVHYITSDPNDSIFEKAKENQQLKAYYIGEKKLITLMMKMEADIVVMTMPDLENFHIKRSYLKKDIEYIFIPHSMDSLNMTMRTASMDHFDTVFCTGKHQREEALKTEIAYNLPKRNLVDWGYCLLDDMRDCYAKMDKKEKGYKSILIAPSWYKDNIVDSCLEELLDNLKGHGYKVTVRPHPQHVKHQPEKMEGLKERYKYDEDIEIQTDFSSNSTIFEADMMITDWSGIAYEYAFTTCKPVLFIDTPMKIMNPEYQKIDTVPINIWMRNEIGTTLKPDQMDMAAETVQTMLANADAYYEKIDAFVHEYVYNLGDSAKVGATYIIKELQSIISKNKEK